MITDNELNQIIKLVDELTIELGLSHLVDNRPESEKMERLAYRKVFMRDLHKTFFISVYHYDQTLEYTPTTNWSIHLSIHTCYEDWINNGERRLVFYDNLDSALKAIKEMFTTYKLIVG